MKRYKWLDVAKAIAIVSIVLGHVLRTGYVRDIVYYFHVPVFFFLSGITAKEEPLMKQICSDAKKLMLPYYVFGIASIAIYAVLGEFVSSSIDAGGMFSVGESVTRLAYCALHLPFNAPLWFLPCIFITRIWQRILFCVAKGNHIVMAGLALIGGAVGFWYTGKELPSLPFSFELMLKLFPFYISGNILAHIVIENGEKNDRRLKHLIFGAICMVSTCALGILAPSINYTNNRFPSPLLFYVVASLGGVGVYFLAVFLQNVRWLSYLGENSMSILLMHKFPIVFFQVIGPFAKLLSRPDSLIGLVFGAVPVTIISIIASLAVGKIIERYAPGLLGKQKPKGI